MIPGLVTRRWDGIARRFVAVPDGLEQEPYCIVLFRIREKEMQSEAEEQEE